MNRLNTIHKTTIQNNNIRNEPVEKRNKIILPKIQNNVPTKSSILSENIISNSDTDEKINIDKNDHKTIINGNNRKMPTIYHSSSEFLTDLAKGPIYLKSQSHNKIITDNVEIKLNTITQYTSPVAFKKINTTSPITSTTKNTSTLSIQKFQYKQNLEPASEKFDNTSNYKNETKYGKTAPKQIIDYDRGSIPPSTDEIPKTTNIKIFQKSGSEYISDDISSNNNNNSDSSFFRIVTTPPILKINQTSSK